MNWTKKAVWLLVVTLMAGVLMLPLTVNAATVIDSGSCGYGVSWQLDSEGVLTVSGEGKMTDLNNQYAQPWGSHREQITKVVISKGVTGIGQHSFEGCTSLKSVTVADSVLTIGNEAFDQCRSLTTVTLSDGVRQIGDYAFNGCAKLTQITFPASVSEFGYGAFHYCNGLTIIIFQGDAPQVDTTNHSENCVFSNGCTATAYFPKNNTTWSTKKQERMGVNLVWVAGLPETPPESNEQGGNEQGGNEQGGNEQGGSDILGSGECGENLKWVLKTDGVLTISGTGMMWNMENDGWAQFADQIKSVVIEDGVNGIGVSAFMDCTYITGITIPDSVTEIGSKAFVNCDSLTSIVVPKGVTEIAQQTFSGCDNLSKVVLPAGITEIGAWAFSYCVSLKNFVIPGSVTSIASQAFSHCESLGELIVPRSVAVIGYRAFEHSGVNPIIFERDTQPFGWHDDVFYWTTVTAYYPENSKGWKDLNDQGGAVTWIPTQISSGVCGESVNWTLFNGSLTISGTGAMADYTADTTPWHAYAQSIETVTVNEGVTGMGAYALSGCSTLTEVRIPLSMASIAPSAFDGCNKLAKVQYGGTAKTWKQIRSESGNDALLSANVAYTDLCTSGHTWSDATCEAPRTCNYCDATEGALLGHTWTDATCTSPKTCSVCGATEGKASAHQWKDGACTVCGKKEASDPAGDGKAEDPDQSEGQDDSGSFLWIVVVLVAVAALAGGAILLVKKKNTK